MSNHPSGLAVSAQGVEKSFDDWPVLWDLDLTVEWGELFLLLGPNGAGKTTLLRVLSTRVRPDSGRVAVAGLDCRRQADQVRRRIGVVAHRSFLHDDLTCRENLVYYGRLFGLADAGKRSAEALASVGLGHRADHRVRTLSNGMQKRVSIARAMLHEPHVFLMDEPESGLDAESLDMLGSLVARWTADGRSVLMTTHNLEVAGLMSERAASVRQGQLQQGKVSFPVEGQAPAENHTRASSILVPGVPVSPAGRTGR